MDLNKHFFKKIYKWQTHEMMLKITNHKRNENQTTRRCYRTPIRMTTIKTSENNAMKRI
jgi:hypothetical protein